MSNEAINAHIKMGQPLGDDATLKEIADWAGGVITNNLSEFRLIMVQNELYESLYELAHNYQELTGLPPCRALSALQMYRDEGVKEKHDPEVWVMVDENGGIDWHDEEDFTFSDCPETGRIPLFSSLSDKLKI